MKNTILILILVLFTTLAFGQVSESTFLGLERQNYGTTFEQKLKKTQEVLVTAEQFAEENGISVSRTNLKNKEGKSYPALVIETRGSSPQNIEAARVARVMSNLPLVLSPLDMSSGSAAFFDPNGSKLGVPYAFFTEGVNNSSYLHELYHANTYQQILSGKPAPWAGTMRVLNGFFISSKNTSYYFRFASLDEINATALSIKLDADYLAELKRVQTPQDFNRSRGAADNRLISVYQSALAGKYLARQAVDVGTRALAKLSESKTKTAKLTVGTNSKNVFETSFSLESYSHEIVGSRGANGNHAIADGLSFVMYSSKSPTTAELTKRLQDIISKSTAAEKLFTDVEKNVNILIEYPQIAKTDINALQRAAQLPFKLLQ